MKTRFGNVLALGSAVLGAFALAGVQAADLTVVSHGGTFQESQRKTYFEPFAKHAGITIREDNWSGNLAQIETQVQSRNIQWDVVNVSFNQAGPGCAKGLLEVIDWSKIEGGRDKFSSGTTHDCAVPSSMSGMVLAYNAEAFPGEKPQALADFFNVQKFPGKRGVVKRAKQNLEVMLIADGVPPAKVYEVLGTEEGVQRAFRKFSEVKNNIVWWTAWSQPPQLLLDGEVSMTFNTVARISRAAKDTGRPLRVIWDGAAVTPDMWGIPKGSPRKDLAYRFINFASSEERQMAWGLENPQDPVVKSVIDKLPADVTANWHSNPKNQKNMIVMNPLFWLEHEEDYERRFQAWLN